MPQPEPPTETPGPPPEASGPKPGPSGPRPKPYDALGEAKRLLRQIRAGALATLAPEGPFSSLVSVATLPDGSPLIVVSQLSAHTRHLQADPRCSLLLPEGGKGDPLAHPRLTLVGRAERATPDERPAWRARYLARHPKAELYVDFADFSFWRIAVTAAHLNGGFARAASFAAAEVLTATEGAEALVEAEPGAVEHMNADHRDAMRLYATSRAGAPDGDWRMSGLDPDGIDLAWGDRTARLAFPARITGPGELRRVLVEWAKAARQDGAADPPAAE